MAEWPIAPVLKTGSPQGLVGSNPTSSDFAPQKRKKRRTCVRRGVGFELRPMFYGVKQVETAAPAV